MISHHSQEHLDKLIDRQTYLRNVIASVKKKIGHRNWEVTQNHGFDQVRLSQQALMSEFITVSIEVEYLTEFLAA